MFDDTFGNADQPDSSEVYATAMTSNLFEQAHSDDLMRSSSMRERTPLTDNPGSGVQDAQGEAAAVQPAPAASEAMWREKPIDRLSVYLNRDFSKLDTDQDGNLSKKELRNISPTITDKDELQMLSWMSKTSTLFNI